jgi:hypothetical protein
MPLPSSGQISLGDIANEFDYELSNIEIVIINNHVCEENCNICPCSICLDNFQDSNNLRRTHIFQDSNNLLAESR